MGDIPAAFLALSRLRRRRFDECVAICDPILVSNPYDQVRGLGHALETLTDSNLSPKGDLVHETKGIDLEKLD